MNKLIYANWRLNASRLYWLVSRTYHVDYKSHTPQLAKIGKKLAAMFLNVMLPMEVHIHKYNQN